MIQTKPVAEQITPLVQRDVESEEEEEELIPEEIPEEEEEKEKEEEEPIQFKADAVQTPAITPRLASRINTLKVSGHPVPESVRNYFEPRFGYDFSDVRIHADSKATQLNKDLNAKAFTHGKDIYFNTGKYSPHTALGKQLLAHELTHVIQQQTDLRRKTILENPNNRFEKGYHEGVADQVMSAPQEASLGWMLESEYPECEGEEEAIQTKPVADHITPLMQRQVDEEETEEEPEEEEKEEDVQFKTETSHTPKDTSNLESRIHSLKGSGQPLPESTRNYFEPRLGYNFSKVRVHSSPRAADTAKSINAKAFTKGKDIIFGASQYSPDTPVGKKLLAHELTHIVQQSGMQRSLQLSTHHPSTASEPVYGIRHFIPNSQLRVQRQCNTPSCLGIVRHTALCYATKNTSTIIGLLPLVFPGPMPITHLRAVGKIGYKKYAYIGFVHGGSDKKLDFDLKPPTLVEPRDRLFSLHPGERRWVKIRGRGNPNYLYIQIFGGSVLQNLSVCICP